VLYLEKSGCRTEQVATAKYIQKSFAALGKINTTIKKQHKIFPYLPNDFYVFSFILIRSVAIGKPEQKVRKASHCGSKKQSRSFAAITLHVR